MVLVELFFSSLCRQTTTLLNCPRVKNRWGGVAMEALEENDDAFKSFEIMGQ